MGAINACTTMHQQTAGSGAVSWNYEWNSPSFQAHGRLEAKVGTIIILEQTVTVHGEAPKIRPKVITMGLLKADKPLMDKCAVPSVNVQDTTALTVTI